MATLNSWARKGLDLMIDGKQSLAWRRFLSVLFLFALIVFAILRVNVGISNSHVPLSDESGRLGGAYRTIASGAHSLSAYDHLYGVLFFRFGLDAVSAHRVFRVIASALSAVAMFFFLLSLPRVSPFGAFLATLLWNINLLNVPYVQDYNHSLFTFALALIAASVWLGFFAARVPLVGSILFLPVAFLRPEYWVMPVMAVGWDAAFFLHHKWTARWFRLSAIGLVGFMVVVFAAPQSRQPLLAASARAVQHADNYLFLGLKQCYTEFLLRRGEIQGVDWGYEYGLVIRDVFPGAQGFFHAAAVNSPEFFRYLVLNTIDNVSRFPMMLSQHSVVLPMSVEAVGSGGRPYFALLAERVFFLAGFAFSIVFALVCALKESHLRLPGRILMNPGLFSLVMLAVVAIPAVVLLIPRPRYWISLVPIAYFGVAFTLSKLVVIRSPLSLAFISVAAAFIFSPSVFLSKYTGSHFVQTQYVYGLKEVLGASQKSNVRLHGFRPGLFCDMALPIQCTGEDLGGLLSRGTSFSDLVHRRETDCLIIDGSLRRTNQYSVERRFFEEFEANPERYDFTRVYHLGAFSLYCSRSLFH